MSKISLKEFIENKHGKSDKEDNYEWFVYESKRVWVSGPDVHRWYTNYDCVYAIDIEGEKRYFSHYYMDIKGDSDPEDCGWEFPDLNDLTEVFPKEVLTTIYVKK